MADPRDPAPRLLDVSVVVGPGTPEWPGDVPFSCGWTCTIAGGAAINLSAMTLSPHVGTHADAPLHVADGAPASDALPLDAFLGACEVVDVTGLDGELSYDALAARGARAGATRLLLRTGRTIADGAFPDAWPWLAPDCVARLAAEGLRLLGVDAPSVDARESKTLATHHALFGAGAYNLENLDLRGVAPGRYELVAPPLRVAGLDGAPVRALLREG
ncbi:cyclase family protein [Roseisolibacter sp. H3M3-2]|uniref:cyclase family protein n=1 Tax=Roseisolibacter sp. H3M3-2 TaxID=3031323 RepID=UPI0023DCAC0F|nr:cyclase family protein [Roseisolibacter sp. H3M3-2]MDF1502672.1 cyclase family protein [Roseisolibacter sp. H3M3-2]